MQFHVALVPSDKPLVAKAANLTVANLTLQNYNSQWVAAIGYYGCCCCEKLTFLSLSVTF